MLHLDPILFELQFGYLCRSWMHHANPYFLVFLSYWTRSHQGWVLDRRSLVTCPQLRSIARREKAPKSQCMMKEIVLTQCIVCSVRSFEPIFNSLFHLQICSIDCCWLDRSHSLAWWQFVSVMCERRHPFLSRRQRSPLVKERLALIQQEKFTHSNTGRSFHRHISVVLLTSVWNDF